MVLLPLLDGGGGGDGGRGRAVRGGTTHPVLPSSHGVAGRFLTSGN